MKKTFMNIETDKFTSLKMEELIKENGTKSESHVFDTMKELFHIHDYAIESMHNYSTLCMIINQLVNDFLIPYIEKREQIDAEKLESIILLLNEGCCHLVNSNSNADYINLFYENAGKNFEKFLKLEYGIEKEDLIDYCKYE